MTADVVECASYRGGRRRPGTPGCAEALRSVRAGGGFVWLDLRDPTPDGFAAATRPFDLHELAGDAATGAHRSMLQRYGETTVFVLRTTRYLEHAEPTDTADLVRTGSVVVLAGPDYVITVRHGPGDEIGVVRAGLERRVDLLAQGPWTVALAVCQRVVDGYAEVADAVEDAIDALEEHVFAPDGSSRVARIYQFKRELMEFRRAVAPLQRPLGTLHLDRERLPAEVRRRVRAVNGRLVRTVERINGYDELINSLLQARLAQVIVDQGRDIRRIASWAAIAAVQTAIAGVYGMRFAEMPETQWRYGYPVVLTVMLASAVGLYRLLRRAGWL